MFRTKPTSPDEVSLEGGRGYQAALSEILNNPPLLAHLWKTMGASRIRRMLQEAEMRFRAEDGRLAAAGVPDDQAAEAGIVAALNSPLLSPPQDPTETSSDQEHAQRERALRRFLASAPRTYPPETTGSPRPM